METINVQVLFTEETPYGEFTDALYFPYEDFPSVTTQEKEALKQERVDSFIDAIENPVPPIEEEE